MDPRAVALQGIGYTPLLVAVQGFAPVPVRDRVNGGGGRYTDEDIRRLVEEKWQAIEAAQGAQPVQTSPVPSTHSAPPVQIPADLEQIPMAAVQLAPPALFLPAQPMAPQPLLPDAAERAREARRRNDEDALILMLAELL